MYWNNDSQADLMYCLLKQDYDIDIQHTGKMSKFGYEDVFVTLTHKPTGHKRQSPMYRALNESEMASKSKEMWNQLNNIHKADNGQA